MNKVEYPVEIENLSQNGAGVLHKGELEAGAPLELVLGGDVRRSGVVRWSRDGRAGIWFAPPLEPADLETIRRFSSCVKRHRWSERTLGPAAPTPRPRPHPTQPPPTTPLST